MPLSLIRLPGKIAIKAAKVFTGSGKLFTGCEKTWTGTGQWPGNGSITA